MDAELNNQENTDWYNKIFKPFEDSVEYYSAKLKLPQTPAERKISFASYNRQLFIFRNQLKNFVQLHSTDDSAAKALIITCFRGIDVNMDTLYSIAEILIGQGLQNKYANYFFQEIQGRKNDEAGKMFIPFSMADINNNTISSDDMKGKYTLILFWASWCIPCRAEIPRLSEVYSQFKNKNFDVLAVSMDTNKQNWLRAVRQDKTGWHNLFDGNAWNDDVARNYAVHIIPKNLLLDTSGKIIARNISPEGLRKILSKTP
ncbi:MAG: TlpA disulfide reductase family protein [Arachidicoccus sp.]|nr:TlpA disulfide reductase family protein [Arachidicoccus sp.]